jgi:hypothetical protein
MKPPVALSLFVISCFAGCVNYNPAIQPEDPGFVGLKDRLAETKLLRVFIIHGMKTHDPAFAHEQVARLANRLDLSAASPPFEDHRLPVAGTLDESEHPVIRVYKLQRRRTGERMVVYAYNWSPLTRRAKSLLDADSAVPRAKLNGLLKREIINDGFSDAVLYDSLYQDNVIGKAAVSALSRFLNREHDDPDTREGGEPIFISHSLGSKILVDALDEILAPREAGNSSQEVSLYQKAVTEASLTKLVIMFANQIPLLSLDEAAGGKASLDDLSPARQVTKLLNVARKEVLSNPTFDAQRQKLNPADPVDVLVFSDPNDLLSYALPVAANPPFVIHNIGYVNSCDFFGLVENPAKAHTGYIENVRIIDLLIQGLRRR